MATPQSNTAELIIAQILPIFISSATLKIQTFLNYFTEAVQAFRMMAMAVGNISGGR
jgi:hypothetical protein